MSEADTGVRRRILRTVALLIVVILVVTGVGFSLLSAWEGVAKSGARFRRVDFRWLSAATLVWTAALYCQGARWRCLMAPRPRPNASALALVLGGTNVIHLAMPGPVAELAAALFVRRRYGMPVASAVASAMLTRFLALGVLGMVTLALWAPISGRVPQQTLQWMAPVVVLLGVGGLVVGTACRRPTWVADVLGRAAGLAGPRIGARVRARAAWWASCFAAVGQLGPAAWSAAAAWSFGNIAALSLGSWMAYRAVGVHADPTGVVFLHGLLSVANVAMIVTPGGIGAVDALAVVTIPAVLAVTTEDAALCTLALRWIQLASMSLGVAPMAWMLAQLPASIQAEVVREIGEP